MKKIMRYWKKLGNYEKTVIALVFGFVVFTLGCFFGEYEKAICPICQYDLVPGTDYFWDVRTGDLLPVSKYLHGQSDVLWFAGRYHIPQEVSITRQRGYARFPDEVTNRARYCGTHRSPFERSQYFCVVSAEETYNVCYAIPDGGTLAPEGQTILKHFNNNLDCWELVVIW